MESMEPGKEAFYKFKANRK